MYNYLFNIVVDSGNGEMYDDKAYILADDYDSAIDKLFNNYEFINYEFCRIV